MQSLTDQRVTDLFREIAAKGQVVPNLYEKLAGSPALLVAWINFSRALRETLGLSDRIRELVIMRTAQLREIPYEWVRHWDSALAAGASREQLVALHGWEMSSEFDLRERGALRATDNLHRLDRAPTPGPSLGRDELSDLSESDYLELTAIVAFYRCVETMVAAYDVQIETCFTPGEVDLRVGAMSNRTGLS